MASLLRLLSTLSLLTIGIAPVSAWAQSAGQPEAQPPEIDWQTGPCVGRLGSLAEIQVPAGMVFTGREGTKKWMENTHNLANDDMLGVIAPITEDQKWWVIFEYNEVGHVPDEEKDKLDASAILKSVREGTAEANKERRKRGWDEMEIVGWAREPFYDPSTNNLTWAIRGRSPTGENVNYSVRLLGREGYMSADLVLAPEELSTAIGPFDRLLSGYSYVEGKRYAEYRKGDKLAAYGLTALVAGGAGAIAAKTGLLAKFWKLIVVAVLAGAAAFRRFFSTIFNWGKRSSGGPGPSDSIEPK